MKKYEAYKDSGVEWIGTYPANWNKMTIRRITDDHKQGFYSPSGYTDSGFRLVRITDLDEEGNIDVSSSPFVTLTENEENIFKVRKGDFLFPRTGSIGLLGVAKNDMNAAFASYLIRFRFRSDVVPDFMRFYFLSDTFINGLLSDLHGGVNQNIHAENIKDQSIVLPSVEEQIAISKHLDHKTSQLHTLITKKEKLIELLQEERTAIINHAVTKGLDPNVPMKDTGIEWLGEIPEHWEVKKLKYVGQCQNGVSGDGEYFGSGFPFVSYGDVYKNTELPLRVSGLAKSTDADRENFSVMEGDIFFTRTSETIEEIGLASTCMKTIENAIFAGFLIRFRPFKGMLIKEFSKYYFRCHIQRLFFVKEMNLVTRASLSQELLKRLPVLLPGLEEQKKISDFLDSAMNRINTTISKTQQEIELLKEYKTALISEVVTGKVDVRNERLN